MASYLAVSQAVLRMGYRLKKDKQLQKQCRGRSGMYGSIDVTLTASIGLESFGYTVLDSRRQTTLRNGVPGAAAVPSMRRCHRVVRSGKTFVLPFLD